MPLDLNCDIEPAAKNQAKIESSKARELSLSESSESGICVQLNALKKSYSGGKILALDQVSLEIKKGEIFGLIGPNGAGKTTIIGCMLGLLRPDSGSVLINGKSPEYYSAHKELGYMPERPDFEHWMSGRQFLSYHHELAGKDDKTRNADIVEALEFVELDKSCWDRRLKTYSRGMLQRLNLAQLYLGKGSLLLMDEPTLGLDPTGVAVVRKFVQKARDEGVTAVVNSHQLDEIERLCDRVAFIKRGKIAAIEKLKGEDFCDYVLCIRFSKSGSAASACASDLQSLASGSQSELCQFNSQQSKFVVKNAECASILIKDLVSAGYLIEEAVPERSRLEQLFLNGSSNGESSDL